MAVVISQMVQSELGGVAKVDGVPWWWRWPGREMMRRASRLGARETRQLARHVPLLSHVMRHTRRFPKRLVGAAAGQLRSVLRRRPALAGPDAQGRASIGLGMAQRRRRCPGAARRLSLLAAEPRALFSVPGTAAPRGALRRAGKLQASEREHRQMRHVSGCRHSRRGPKACATLRRVRARTSSGRCSRQWRRVKQRGPCRLARCPGRAPHSVPPGRQRWLPAPSRAL